MKPIMQCTLKTQQTRFIRCIALITSAGSFDTFSCKLLLGLLCCNFAPARPGPFIFPVQSSHLLRWPARHTRVWPQCDWMHIWPLSPIRTQPCVLVWSTPPQPWQDFPRVSWATLDPPPSHIEPHRVDPGSLTLITPSAAAAGRWSYESSIFYSM